ncbi:hypothetical protein P4668_25300 [Priestia megaterium]|uniref:hypothetical protein n=1 Tax=Priestia megaterium TaxID=1404 RepID=UPI002E24BEFC|nr:hypothetical protein [Priestia megaterium]
MEYNLPAADRYFKWLALFLPISSFLLIPSVQGTTIGYFLAFFLFVFVAMFKGVRSKFYIDFIKLSLVFGFITVAAQWILGARSYVSLDGLRLVDETLYPVMMRSSMITQSIYLIPCFLLMVFVKNFYNEKWDKYAFRGAILISIYGIYEFLYFFVFKDNGDFISNRTFGDGSHEGSLFQTYTVAGMALQRIKSLTGEPSMFALTILPFWIYSMHLKRKFLSIFFFIVLALSNSTTAFLGIGMYILLYIRYNFQSVFKMYFVVLFGFIGCMFIGFNKIILFFQTNFGAKLSAQNVSGAERTMYMQQHLEYFMDMPFMSKLFGLGFGYARSTDFFSTILVNTGIIGTLLFTLLFLYPVFKLGYSDKEIGLKCSLIVLYVAMMISVPEFSYLSIWLFLGISYYYVDKAKRKQREEEKEREKRILDFYINKGKVS